MTPAEIYHYGSIWRNARAKNIGCGTNSKGDSIAAFCCRNDLSIVGTSKHYTVAKHVYLGDFFVLSLNGDELWIVDAPQFGEKNNPESIDGTYIIKYAKKNMGRPPLPAGQKRMRLHISLPPDLAKLAMQDPAGPSAYIEKFLSLATLLAP